MSKLSSAEQAFYEWFHESGRESISLEAQREIFRAGWDAAEMLTSHE
jgi:hypothetical protein